jgi:hypothetical protein
MSSSLRFEKYINNIYNDTWSMASNEKKKCCSIANIFAGKEQTGAWEVDVTSKSSVIMAC